MTFLKLLMPVIAGILLCQASFAEIDRSQLLHPVKTDSPRATLKSFYDAMSDYKKGVETKDSKLEKRIFDAIRTFDLEDIKHTDKETFSKRAAVFLKETMDRVILLDYEKVPSDELVSSSSLKKWRLKDTEIKMSLQQEGERQGEWLFTKDTVLRAREFFSRVKHVPYVAGSGMGASYSKPWYETEVPEWLKGETLFMPKWQILALFFSILIGLILRKVIFFVVDNIKKFTDKSQTDWDDKIIEASEYTLGSIAACLFWFLSIRVMNLEGNSFLILDVLLKVLLSFFVIKLAYQLVDVFTSYLGTKAAETDFPLDDQLVPLIRKSLRIFTVIFGALIAVQNLGVNVMSVLAGLGLGGLAFALAAKDACANLFGSFMILLDKPFRVGDHIVFNGVEGSVEEIGFRSTKIRSFYGSQISVPNSSLANVNIDNMGRRKTRRLRTTLGLTYDTSPAQMEAFLEGLKNIIRANPYTVKQGFNIAFSEYGDFSLNVLINVFLDVPDHGMELLQKQNIFLEAMRLAEDIGVDFAFPTQSLYLQNQEPIAAKVVNDEEYSTLARSYGPDGSKAMPKGKGLFTPAFMD